jgi:hypothetical protein
MKKVRWIYDETTDYWARELPSPIKSEIPIPQYKGGGMTEDTWKRYILKPRFPDYCYDSGQPRYLYCSPRNIIQCLKDRHVLESLALIMVWGTMFRTMNKSVYIRPLPFIEQLLLKCIGIVESKNSIERSWELLTDELSWTAVMKSKYLHFLTRSLGFEANPPVAIDRGVIMGKVWPKYENYFRSVNTSDEHPFPGIWFKYGYWIEYNR